METRSERRKRQRSMSISSHVSSWPHVPARFELLNDDTLRLILKFVGNKSYRSFGGVNKHCKEIYLTTEEMTKETYVYGYAPLSVIKDKIERERPGPGYNLTLHKAVGKGVVFYNRMDFLLWASQLEDKHLLSCICDVAAEEGRIDVLVEVLNNVNTLYDKKYVLQNVDLRAALGGKLNLLKWLEGKGFVMNTTSCAKKAARHGHLDILEWLQKEKGLRLRASLYYETSIGGGQLCVIKWLREKKVPWDDDTFKYATRKGNLDILQWLHDEGCPWPEDYHVRERRLKPGVLDWLRSNGYSDRVYV